MGDLRGLSIEAKGVRIVGIFVGVLLLVFAVALLARLLLRVRASRRT